jgi:class 3 adenylate cyclase/tetratricopeptide (TPR) repeat protein
MSSSVTATFVFTDLVDSTATGARLGPAAAEELRQTHFRLLRGAVAASGGTEVKNLGDGLMVMYSSPSRALSGAAGMQQAIEHYNRTSDEPLGVRIGMSVGEAVEDEGDYFGDPVVEAARLCAVAQGGQILANTFVGGLVGRHATQTFVELGPLELKGLPEPVDAVEVVWEPAVVEGSIPLPGRLVGAASDALFGFFGRAEELAAIDDARKQARSAQRCQVVLVAGEAGMGKTSLIGQAARAAHAEGAVVLFGHAAEDTGIAYQPWIEVISALVRHGDPDTLAGLRVAQRAALGRLVPEIGSDAARVADPDTERLLMWEGAVELLAAESRHHPVIVVLDDLHWADTASLQLLRHVIASATPMNVTVACTYRDTDLGRTDPLTELLADLHREANVARIALRGLDDVDLVELLAAAAGHDLDDAGIGLAHALRSETDGNPFFTGELLRHLGESGGIVFGDDGRWAVAGDLEELGLPNSVRDVVGRRVARLGDEALRVLPVAAVIGREFDIALLAELVDVDEDPLLDLVDAAVTAAILTETETPYRYRFAHALVQHSLYDELSPTRRQRAHQRIGEALEARSATNDAASLAELAHHWIAATGPTDVDKALTYALRAGDAARDALAPDDAVRWYQQAIDLVSQQSSPDPHQRAALLAELGSAQHLAARPEYRETLLKAIDCARATDADDVLIRAALSLRGLHVGGSVGDEVVKDALRSALDRVGTGATATRARILAGLVTVHDAAAEAEARHAFAQQAVDVARESGDDTALLEVTIETHLTVATPDRRDEHIVNVERSVAIADRSGDPDLRGRVRFLAMWAHYQRADLVAVDRTLHELAAIADEGLPYAAMEHAMFQTGRHLLRGDVDGAERENERFLDAGTALEIAETLGTYGGLLYSIRHQQGRLDELAGFFVDAARDNPSIAALRSAVVLMLCELGRIDEARERLSFEASNDFHFPYDIVWLAAMSNLIDAAVSCDDRVAARTLCERLTPFSGHVISPSGAMTNGAMARPLARAATLLGDHDQAEKWFTTAHDLNARLEAPFWIARAQLDHADLCLARHADGDLERARELITTAAATAAEYGCAGLTRRADDQLASL